MSLLKWFDAIKAVAYREIKRIFERKVLIFIMLIGPVFTFLLVYNIFNKQVIRDLPIVVVDQDQSRLSSSLTRMIDASPIVTINEFVANISEAQSIMYDGNADAIVVIPTDFERGVYSSNPKKVEVYINNTNVVKGGIINSALYKTLSSFSVQAKVATQMKKGVPLEGAIDKALPLNISTHLLYNSYGNYAWFLAMGLMPMMLTVFVFMGTLYAFGIELKERSGHDLLETAQGKMSVVVIGKLIPYLGFYVLIISILNILMFSSMGLPLNGHWGYILLMEGLLVLAYQMIALLVLGLTSNLRLSLSLGSAFTMMALTFSGLTFPQDGMPLIARLFSWIFPYTPWLKGFVEQSLKGIPVVLSLKWMWILMIYCLVGVLGLPLLKKKFADEKHWGKS